MAARYSHFGGLNTETALLHNIMQYYGIKNPHTDQPYSPAMVFGIGGGIGYGYFVFGIGGRIGLVLGNRHLWQDSPAFVRAAAARFGLTPTVFEGGSKKAAQQALDEAITAERPAMTWVDMASLPYRLLPTSLVKYFVHVVTVVGKDGEDYQLDDRAAVPIAIDPATLAEARAVMPYLKNRIMTFEQPPVPDFSLEAAVKAGIETCYTSALNPPIKNFGLESLTKWADLMTHPKDKKGWPQLYSTGPVLFEACKSIFRAIETDATGGGSLRPLYADFLDEAADLLNEPALQSVAAKCREAGQQWTALAEAALPDSIPAFAESKALTRQRWQLYEQQGAAALPAMTEVSQKLSAIGAKLADDFPLSPAEMSDLRTNLRQHLLDIYATEKALLDELQTVSAKVKV